MALIGYARVSSPGQSLAVELDKLKQWDKSFQEKVSAASGKSLRLETCLERGANQDIDEGLRSRPVHHLPLPERGRLSGNR